MAGLMSWLVSRQLPPIITGVIVGVGGDGREVVPLPEFREEFADRDVSVHLLPACRSAARRGRLRCFWSDCHGRKIIRHASLRTRLPELAESGHQSSQFFCVGIDFVEPADGSGGIAQDHVF